MGLPSDGLGPPTRNLLNSCRVRIPGVHVVDSSPEVFMPLDFASGSRPYFWILSSSLIIEAHRLPVCIDSLRSASNEGQPWIRSSTWNRSRSLSCFGFCYKYRPRGERLSTSFPPPKSSIQKTQAFLPQVLHPKDVPPSPLFKWLEWRSLKASSREEAPYGESYVCESSRSPRYNRGYTFEVLEEIL